MSRRICTLSMLGMVILLVTADGALAHALIANYRVLVNQQVRVEAWFETDDPASGAKVQVLRADKSVLVKGKMDDEGVFLFSFKELEPLEIVIDAGQGHGARLSFSAEALGNPSIDTGPLRLPQSSENVTEPGVGRPPTPFPIRDVILGITFLLALAAFVLSLRNARALTKHSHGPTTPS